jgi:hypothetical protein
VSYQRADGNTQAPFLTRSRPGDQNRQGNDPVTLTLGLGAFIEPVAPAFGATGACGEPGKDGAVTDVGGVPK